jgi:RNA polymerase sigma-70 factor (sigma-E family)
MTSMRDEQFGSFVLARRAELVRTATMLAAGDRHLAEDLVQSTLTRLYLAWSSFQKAGNPHAYVHRALVNALFDEHRRPWRQRERPFSNLPERPVHGTEGSSRADEVRHALRELPPRMRAALVFRYFHDLSVAETAQALGCRQGTVKSQTARALDRLRTVLEAGPPIGTGPSHPPLVRPGRPRTAPGQVLAYAGSRVGADS